MKTFDNVAKLKLATLTTGQFVETGGYYTKGGGGAAKYLIVAPQAADGYGDHVLANGNVAVLQTKGDSVNYSQFGAYLDGVNTDNGAINAAHLYAKSNKLNITQCGGTSLISTSTTIVFSGINCSFSGGFKFKLNDDPSGDVFLFEPEYSTTTLNQTDINISEFTKNSIAIPSLSAYKYQYCVIKSVETDLIRVGGQVQTKGDVTVLGVGGEIVYPLTTTYGSIASITLSPINISVVEIKGFTLETSGTVDAAYPIKVTRNNVKFVNPRYINSNTSTSIAVQQLFSLDGCYNTVFEDPICDSLSDGRVDFNYAIAGGYYCKLRVSGMNSFEGWAQIDGNYTRDVKVIDSTLDRAGGHFHCFDYTFENIVCNRVNPIDLSGGGQLSVRGIKINVNGDYIDSAIPSVVVIRADYGCEWDGSIDIDDVLIDARGVTALTGDKTFYVVNGAIDSSANGHDFGRDLTITQYLNIDDVTMKSPIGLAQKFSLQSARLGVATTPSGGHSAKYPSRVQVSNSNIDNTGSGAYNANMSVYLFGSGMPAIADTYCDIAVDKCDNDDPRDFGLNPYDSGQILSLFTDAITNLTIISQSIDCNWERISITAPNRHDKVRGRSAAIAGTGTINQRDVMQSATAMSGTWRGAWFGGVIEAYMDAGNVAFKQVGFPNNIEDNLTFAKNVQTEVNGAIKTATLTIADIDTGYKDSAFYQ